MKTAVVYYSHSGSTQQAAAYIARALQADLIAIQPKHPIPAGKWGSLLLGGMQATFGMHPKLKAMSFCPQDYDRILLGAPIWAGKCAAPVGSFLRQYDVSEKVAGVFLLSASGDAQGGQQQLQPCLPHRCSFVSLTDSRQPALADNAAKLEAFLHTLL